MAVDTLIALALAAAAVGYLVRGVVRARRAARDRARGCDHCG